MSDGVTWDMTAMPRTTALNASTSVLKKERGYRVRMKAAVTLHHCQSDCMQVRYKHTCIYKHKSLENQKIKHNKMHEKLPRKDCV